jgi:EAL domain-containing protein (putative c-di-GMP-specific phosphodiesterase class I)
MTKLNVATTSSSKPGKALNPLCFVMDEDFVFRQDLARELRRGGIDIVEFSNSARFTDMIDDQNPDIVLVNLNSSAPHECVRALLALKETRYGGAVQLFGQCAPKMLDSFKTVGNDSALRMLAPLTKPINIATLNRIIRDQKLGSASSPSGGISLKDALANNTVRFLYLPKFDIKTKSIAGAELVARIAHPELGLVAPDQFLKGADEQTMLNLSRLALIHGLKESASLLDLGVAFPLAINISAENLLNLPICDLVLMHRPERDGWAGLILEVPERQVIAKIDSLKARAPKLQQSGVSIAIDNFGRLSSRIDMLNQVAFCEIKIDRLLVEGCATNAGNAKICKTIIQMAHNFGGRAVAVGISNEEDLQTLRDLDCDMGQGFLFGKPMNAQQIRALVANATGRAA